MLNAELLAQAARDRRLAHGAVRLLALIQTGEPARNNRWHEYAQQMAVVSTGPFRKQLLEYGYLPPVNKGGFHSQKRHHDSQNASTEIPTATTSNDAG